MAPPPFDNFKARQALPYLASQDDCNAAVMGNVDPHMKFRGACFMCGSDNDTNVGAVLKPDLAKGRHFIMLAIWAVPFPGLFLWTMVLAIDILGDGIRDMLDPRIAKRL